LNECYRCAPEIIQFVNKLVPDIIAFEGNASGEVRDGSVDEVQNGDFVLCRNNFPLVKLCYKYIGEGKQAALKGKDVAKSIVELIHKYRRNDLQGLDKFLHMYLKRKLDRLRHMYPQDEINDLMERNQYVITSETVSIILLILSKNPNIQDVMQLIDAIENLFNYDTKEGIILSSIHKSKGLEADRVFILEKELMPSKYAKQTWELEQENNLQYVAYTRAKKSLIFIEDWTSNDSEEE
jgi:superfamily I DNA/RNA helicase